MSQYSKDSGVSVSNISRIIGGKLKKTPSPKMIEKLTKGDARPRGGVGYEDMMVAAGYQDDYLLHKVDEFALIDETEEEKLVNGPKDLLESEKRRRERFMSYRNESLRFAALADGIMYGTLARNKVMFTPVNDIPRERRTLRPDTIIDLKGQRVDTWWITYKTFHVNGIQPGNIAFTRFDILGRMASLEPDKKRKISLVTDSEDLFESFLDIKDRTSYKGDFSVILIDSVCARISREVYISHFDKADTEFLIV